MRIGYRLLFVLLLASAGSTGCSSVADDSSSGPSPEPTRALSEAELIQLCVGGKSQPLYVLGNDVDPQAYVEGTIGGQGREIELIGQGSPEEATDYGGFGYVVEVWQFSATDDSGQVAALDFVELTESGTYVASSPLICVPAV